MTVRARYDGHADWYDEWNTPHIEKYAPRVSELLGPGGGDFGAVLAEAARA